MGRTIREPRVTHQRQARRPVTATRSPLWLSTSFTVSQSRCPLRAVTRSSPPLCTGNAAAVSNTTFFTHPDTTLPPSYPVTGPATTISDTFIFTSCATGTGAAFPSGSVICTTDDGSTGSGTLEPTTITSVLSASATAVYASSAVGSANATAVSAGWWGPGVTGFPVSCYCVYEPWVTGGFPTGMILSSVTASGSNVDSALSRRHRDCV